MCGHNNHKADYKTTEERNNMKTTSNKSINNKPLDS